MTQPEQRTYSLYELAALSGATIRQVDHWTNAGYLHALPRHKTASGIRRRWDAAELRACTRMARLSNEGLSMALAHRVARTEGPYRHRGITITLDDTAETTDSDENGPKTPVT